MVCWRVGLYSVCSVTQREVMMEVHGHIICRTLGSIADADCKGFVLTVQSAVVWHQSA